MVLVIPTSQQNLTLTDHLFQTDESVPICVRSHSPSPAPPQNVVPGAVAVAQSPAARLFSHVSSPTYKLT